MTTSITCSWCHTVNDSRQRWCKTCGHSAWLARLDCDCRKCLGVLFGGEMTAIVPPRDDEPRKPGPGVAEQTDHSHTPNPKG